MDIVDQKISLAVVVKICVFICSILGVWYHTKYQVDSLNEKVDELRSYQKDYNIQVIENDVKYTTTLLLQGSRSKQDTSVVVPRAS